MFKSEKKNSRRIWHYAGFVLLIWLGIILGIGYFGFNSHMINMKERARIKAQANFNKDLSFRYWGTKHGGVYVPVTKETPPSPYLSHVPERDIITPSGRKLTLMNPAYMLRQLMEDFNEEYGIKGHITSLNPLRPQNAPDAWERDALKLFEEGKEEYLKFTTLNGKEYLRYMRPLFVKKGCLKCHAYQGYKSGDLRGGVSVSVPLEQFLTETRNEMMIHFFAYSTLWFMGILGIFFGASRISSQTKNLIQSEKKQKELADLYLDLYDNAPDMYVSVNAKTGRIYRCNQTIADNLGYTKEEIIDSHIFDMCHPNSLDEIKMASRKFVDKGLIRDIELQLKRKDSTKLDVSLNVTAVRDEDGAVLFGRSILHDITEQKKAEMKIKNSLEEKEILLRELYHRTKNNMQVIGSLLYLQREMTENEETKIKLQEAESRIKSMSLVHKKLYQSQNLSSLSLNEYVHDLLDLIKESYDVKTMDIVINTDIDEFTVLIDVAIPIGLVLNELFSNIFKHAFPKDTGIIEIKIKNNNDQISITVQDNGIGVPEGFDFFEVNTLGLQTVINIVKSQLLGTIEFKSDKGVYCHIEFDNKLYSERV